VNTSANWEPQRRARRRALQALYQWQISQQAVSDIIRQFHETQDFGHVDKELFEQLVREVSEGAGELESWLQPSMDRPFSQCDVMERVILLIGAWHLLKRPDVPYQVTINESIDLANRFGSGQSPSYVNGVLDRARRSLDTDQG
jgi:N utilization substance protein B